MTIDSSLIKGVAKKIGFDRVIAPYQKMTGGSLENWTGIPSMNFKFAVVDWVNTHPLFNALYNHCGDDEHNDQYGIEIKRESRPYYQIVARNNDFFTCYLLAADALPSKEKT